MVEPTHVRRSALVSLGVDPLLGLGVRDADHPSFPGGYLLVGVEREHRWMPAASNRGSVRGYRPERLARVLHDRQPQPLERRNLGGIAEHVHGQERRRPLRDGNGRSVGIEVQRDRVDVGEHGSRALVQDHVRARDE